MTATARLARLLRVRTAQHRAATARLVVADAAHTSLAAVAGRIDALLAEEATGNGTTTARALQGRGELVARLDQAQTMLRPRLADADYTRSLREAERVAAFSVETRTERMHADALARETAEREFRAAAALPVRRKPVIRP